MPTEATIYTEANLDPDEAMELLEAFIHTVGWCKCESAASPLAVFSVKALTDEEAAAR